MSNSAQVTFGYKDTEFTRHYTFDGLSEDDLFNFKANIHNLNDSLEAGTAGGISSFFISDDFDAEAGIGYFTGIVAAQYTSKNVTEIDLD